MNAGSFDQQFVSGTGEPVARVALSPTLNKLNQKRIVRNHRRTAHSVEPVGIAWVS